MIRNTCATVIKIKKVIFLGEAKYMLIFLWNQKHEQNWHIHSNNYNVSIAPPIKWYKSNALFLNWYPFENLIILTDMTSAWPPPDCIRWSCRTTHCSRRSENPLFAHWPTGTSCQLENETTNTQNTHYLSRFVIINRIIAPPSQCVLCYVQRTAPTLSSTPSSSLMRVFKLSSHTSSSYLAAFRWVFHMPQPQYCRKYMACWAGRGDFKKGTMGK